MNSPKYVGLVPARAGSRGIKDKNLETIGTKTLLQIAIEGAVSSGHIDSVIVSSDGKHILAEALKHNAIPHERPSQIATDNSLARDVVFDFLQSPFGHSLESTDFIVYLQPTSPFRSSNHIVDSIRLSKKHAGKSVVSVVKIPASLERIVIIDNFSLKALRAIPSMPSKNRQDLTEVYTANGALYLFSIEEFLRQGDIPILESVPYLMTQHDSIDIDSIEDLEFARLIETVSSL